MTNDPSIVIRAAQPNDSAAIAGIYNHYITNTDVTFEVDEVESAEMKRRIIQIQTESFPWLVAETDQILGYAYAGKWHARCAYQFSVETTVYLAHTSKGRGIGSMLYQHLIEILKASKIHTIIGGIALPNAASVALHEKLGFEKAAHYKEVGFKFDRWIDVGYWQRIL